MGAKWVRTNLGKYRNLGAFNLHTANETGKGRYKPKTTGKALENIEVCLNCTKAKCNGSQRCFNDERKKHDQD